MTPESNTKFIFSEMDTGQMNRIKVINDPSDLVTVLRAVDTDVKREIFKKVSTDWRTMQEIVKEYGEEGRDCLIFFEKMKLVETKWQSVDSAPEKAYHSYYMSVHINTTCPVVEISDVLSAAIMNEKDFKSLEKKIMNMVGEEGMFGGDVAKNLDISGTMLRSLVKRSTVLEYRGQRIERIKE